MSFHEIRFPASLSFGAIGGPERRTEIVTLANGFEERNTPWAHSRRRYDAGLGLRSLDDVALLVAFFEARQGQLYGFRWKDWADYKSCSTTLDPTAFDQRIGEGDQLPGIVVIPFADGRCQRPRLRRDRRLCVWTAETGCRIRTS